MMVVLVVSQCTAGAAGFLFVLFCADKTSVVYLVQPLDRNMPNRHFFVHLFILRIE